MGQTSSQPTRVPSERTGSNENNETHESALNDSSSGTSSSVNDSSRRSRLLSGWSRRRTAAASSSSAADGSLDSIPENDDSWSLPQSRRRRRTSSSDETLHPENERKRRQRPSALRRLSQFGSNVVNSLTGNDEGTSSSSSTSSPHTASSRHNDLFSRSNDSRHSLADATAGTSQTATTSTTPILTPSISTPNRTRPPSLLRPHLSTQTSTSSTTSSVPGASASTGRLWGQNGFASRLARHPRPPLFSPRSQPNTSTNRNLDLGTEEYETPQVLSRHLALAAIVTATSLIGARGDESSNGGGNVALQDEDFSGFLRGLNNGSLVNELFNDREENNADGQPQRPHGFFRMFRFPPTPSGDDTPNLVPVLIVGVRAVEADILDHAAGGADDNATDYNSDRESARSAATVDHTNLSGASPSERIARRPLSRLWSDWYDSETVAAREERDREAAHRMFDDERQFNNIASGDIDNGDEDQEDDEDEDDWGLFATRSGASSSRASLLDRLRPIPSNQTTTSTNRDEDWFESLFSGNLSINEERRGLSSSRSQPRHPPTPASPQHRTETSTPNPHRPSADRQARNRAGTQSWIVYVIGNSYPEGHPILVAPSLFTDNPTYEDMIALENALGQVKPPVATQEEVENAGKLFTVGDGGDDEVGADEQRCVVCLEQKKIGDQIRRLNVCGHSFHIDCIDQWLTTGRSACPLCRADAVKNATGNLDSDTILNPIGDELL